MTILVITTGGTIGAMPYKDLKHQPRIKTMPAKGQDFVRTALQKITVKTRVVALESRDSNFIDELYLQSIVQLIETETGPSILITVGTDCILQVADYLQRQIVTNPKFKDKTIILTGAMVAISCGKESDGPGNLAFALRQLSQGHVNRGVYIVLCDYQEPETKAGWASRLYKYEPRQYEKVYDPEDDRRSRIKRL